MSEHVFISEASEELTAMLGSEVRPSYLTHLFYRGLLGDDRCPVVGGRRVIPRDYLPVIASFLRDRAAARRKGDHLR